MKEKVEIALTKEEMPLETLLTLIDNGLVGDEIPFDIIANEYPELLEKWYPGFPGVPRSMNEDDPFCVDGIVKGEFVFIKGIPGIDKLHVPGIIDKEFEMGKCKVWLKMEDGEWTITLQKKEQQK
jgi:hypothetical protein